MTQPTQQRCSFSLARNGRASLCDTPAEPWLLASPRGAYTTARTVGGSSVFELTHHVDRLARSVQLMMEADCLEGKPHAVHLRAKYAHLADPARLRPLVVASLQAAMAEFRKREPSGSSTPASSEAAAPPSSHPSELKLTVLVTWEEQGDDVYAHVGQLPPRPVPPVKVQVRGTPRSNALAKDSAWVRQRQALQDTKPADVNEILLVEPDGGVLEGMASNFFAVVDGAVQTAGEGVLQGTVRSVALLVAEREGIPVVLKAPKLQDVARWEGAFISSTSRLVLPIDELEAPDWGPAPLHAHWPRGGVASRLERLVLQEIEACSERLT